MSGKSEVKDLAKIIRSKEGSSFKFWIGPYALLAIAYAILEVADAIREKN